MNYSGFVSIRGASFIFFIHREEVEKFQTFHFGSNSPACWYIQNWVLPWALVIPMGASISRYLNKCVGVLSSAQGQHRHCSVLFEMEEEILVQKKDVSNEFIIKGPSPLYEPAKGGVGYEIFRSLNLNKGKTAQIFVEDDIFDSYDNLLQRCIRTAVYLLKKQLKKEDIVCLCSGNGLNSMVPFIASTFVGATYASIEPSMSDDDVIYLLNYISPKILFVSEPHEKKIEACLKKSDISCELIIFGDTEKYIRFSDLLVPSEEEKTFQPVFINDLYETVVIYLSSGTTGNSKGICLNHYSLLAQIFNLFHYNYRQGVFSMSNFSQKYDDKEDLRFLFYAPVYWLTGTMFTLGLFFSAGTRVVGTFFSGKNVWEALKKYKPDTIFFPPILANEICTYGMNDEAYTQLKIFIIYGGGVSTILLKTIRKCFPTTTIVQGYGQTENTGLLTGFNIGDPEEINLIEKHPDSCGKIMPTFEMKVVDIDNEKILPKGKQGELRVKDKYMMNGYYKMDSSSAFDSDGWFKTGDVVFFDEDDCLHITDRVKDVIDYALHWIHPSIIEQILYQHPAVFETFVFGYPHPTDTERTYAVVALKDEYQNKVTGDELIDFVNERVPNDWYKIRGGLTFLDKMLKTPTGKLKKLAMKRAIIEKKP